MNDRRDTTMDSSSSVFEVCPTEDVVQALLDYFVAPLLPVRLSVKQTPSLSQQQAVAKQMHAVVLLFNYYQRKCHPAAEVLGFKSWCQLAVVLKPPLIAYMKFMQRADYSDLDDIETQMSLTERTVMDACEISTALDTSKDFPVTDGWPISKVTVLLVDSRKENCLLLFSSITNGTWSAIEKEIDLSNISKSTSKGKIRSRIHPRARIEHVDEATLLQLAFSAIKEVAGINQADLMVLESHVVYSLSKEKTAARFFIVQSTHSTCEDIQFPIKDTIESLQGPPVQKSSCGWRVTPVVEYLHVLPYTGILSDWFSREQPSKSLSVKIGDVDTDSSNGTDIQLNREVIDDQHIAYENSGVTDAIENEAFNGSSESPKQKDSNECQLTRLPDSVNGPEKVNLDNSLLIWTGQEDKIKDTCSAVKVNNHKMKTTASVESGNECNVVTGAIDDKAFSGNSALPTQKINDKLMACLSDSVGGPDAMNVGNSLSGHIQSEDKVKDTSKAVNLNDHEKKAAAMNSDKHAFASGTKLMAEMIDSSMQLLITENRGEEENIQNKNGGISSSVGESKASGDCAVLPHQSNPKNTEKLITTLASNENALSQTTLKVLLQKREKLSLQQRSIEDELALCDKHIQTLLDGDEDDLALKIQVIIDGCRDACLKSEGVIEDQATLCMKRKRSSDAILTMQNPCQELDDICYMNNWTLPTYCAAPSNDGFLANVTIKGMDFDLSGRSELQSSPHKARESAAAKVIALLEGVVVKK